ncbi:MAG: hypothetical protein Q8M31_00290 [Beijerinckiaceae bacterium]|nr:hypothetical protein [Beijerinckiaceae bacterium]
MPTQVVIINLTATVFVDAEDPAAAISMVEDSLADVEVKLGLGKLDVRIGLGDMSKSKAFTEGEDPPGDEDD